MDKDLVELAQNTRYPALYAGAALVALGLVWKAYRTIMLLLAVALVIVAAIAFGVYEPNSP